jgi:hypothetical protein
VVGGGCAGEQNAQQQEGRQGQHTRSSWGHGLFSLYRSHPTLGRVENMGEWRGYCERNEQLKQLRRVGKTGSEQFDPILTSRTFPFLRRLRRDPCHPYQRPRPAAEAPPFRWSSLFFIRNG